MEEEMLQVALQYVDLKLPIIPICSYNHRSMNNTHRNICKSPGKSPIVPAWTDRGVPDPQEVEQWYAKNPYMNVGMIMGKGFVGVDIDGASGEMLLQGHSKGEIPDTWEFATGAGRRLIFTIPIDMVTKKFTKKGNGEHEELAFLAAGQQTIMPPSTHHTGRKYTWTEGKSYKDIDPAPAPMWLVKEIREERTMDLSQDKPTPMSKSEVEDLPGAAVGRGKQVSSNAITQDDWEQIITAGGRNQHMSRLAGSLISKGTLSKDAIKTFLKAQNEQKCVPPLPHAEIDAMVETIYNSEQDKLSGKKPNTAKGKGKKGPPLRPKPFSEQFVEQQKGLGYSWKFNVNKGMFYRCDDSCGPWRPLDTLYCQKLIRAVLISKNPEWDTAHSVAEVVAALKEVLANESDDNVFDLGHNPDVQNVYVDNGTLNWETGELKEWVTSSYSVIKLPVAWHENATCPEWIAALESWIPDEVTRDFVQEFIGYCLIPDTSMRAAVFLYGGGMNGKSLFLHIITKLFGRRHITEIPLHRLTSRFEVAYLQDQLVNICGDIDSKYLEETGLLKALIAGDVLRGEYKHGKSFDFTPVARLMFSANTLPKVSDKSLGWYDRWKLVHFPNQFAVDSSYKSRLLAACGSEEGLSGILSWAVEGLRRWQQNGRRFSHSKNMNVSAQEYRMDNDSVVGFTTEAMIKTPSSTKTHLATSSLYKTYVAWCGENGSKPVGQIEFSKRMQSQGFTKGVRPINKVSTNCFLEVELTEEYLGEYDFNESMRVSVKR